MFSVQLVCQVVEPEYYLLWGNFLYTDLLTAKVAESKEKSDESRKVIGHKVAAKQGGSSVRSGISTD